VETEGTLSGAWDQHLASGFSAKSADQAYASACTDFLRAVTEPVFRAALDQREEGGGIVECLYERIQARLGAEPERYAWNFTLVAALLTRR
jgi:hypothetical protein